MQLLHVRPDAVALSADHGVRTRCHDVVPWTRGPSALVGRPGLTVLVVDATGDLDAALAYASRVRRASSRVRILLELTPEAFVGITGSWQIDDVIVTGASAAEWDVRVGRLADAASPRGRGPDSVLRDLERPRPADLGVRLSRDQYVVLSALLAQPDTVLTRRTVQLVRRRSPDDYDERTVDAFICRLRRKVESHGIRIEAVHRRGYRARVADPQRLRLQVA